MSPNLRQNTPNIPNSWYRSFVPGNATSNSQVNQSQPRTEIPHMQEYQAQVQGKNSLPPQQQKISSHVINSPKKKGKVADRKNSINPDLSFQSINHYIRLSYLFLGILVFAIGGWAILFQIQGAVVTQGAVSVEGKPKIIQHLDGGIIKEILVKEGDYIEQGGVLLKLDPTIIDANQASAETNFYENEALISRLLTERLGHNQIKWSTTLNENKNKFRAIQAMQGQKRIFQARQDALKGQLNQLDLRINKFQEEITGIQSEMNFAMADLNIVNNDLEKLQNLLRQGLVAQERVTIRALDKNRLENEIAKLTSRKEGTTLSIQETQSEINQLHNTRREEILTELRTAQTQADTFNEDLKTITSKNEQIILKAPVSGVVHNMEISTIGGVIIAGQELMQIIPVNDELILQAKLQPQDVDQVSVGQDTKVIFSSLNQKSPPELKGTVQFISADSLVDPITGMPYFTVRVSIPESERVHLEGKKLIPGMPADIFIQTEARSVMNYILAPLKKALNKTMREG